MREYSATSVSKADASSLADKLTEQSREGWELVEIVRTDDQVVAYLSREASGASATEHNSPSSSHGTTQSAATPSASSYGTTSGSTSDSNTSAEKFSTGSTVPAGGYVATETTSAVTDSAGNTFVEDDTVVAPASNDGGVGWAAGSAAGAATSFANQASQSADQTSDAAQHATSSAANQATTVTGAVSAPNNGSAQPTQPTQSGATSGSDLAPAGWYADPAGRFDLRYWDGAQWTEHVARNGHQETDPPIR